MDFTKPLFSALFLLALVKSVLNSETTTPPVDPKGYLIFCLCMGRLGNQMEHFLGALDFAERIDRTLVLPPFVYSDRNRKVNWNEWFLVKPLRQFHRVILAEPFMKLVAPQIWKPGERVGFCWRHPRERRNDDDDYKCDMKRGSPFQPFWDSLRVDFDSYEGTSLSYSDDAHLWREAYPADKFPVIAMQGAPAPFPMRVANWHLQKYVKFSEEIETQTDKFVKGFIRGKKFVGIHLRNGQDWENACDDFKTDSERRTGRNYMASPQCYGENHETNTAPFSYDVCMSSESLVVDTVKRAVKSVGAKLVYIATDQTPYKNEIEKGLEGQKVDVMFLDPDLPLYDLSILNRADLFVGNCFSSFSSMVRRMRDANGKPTWYFGMN